MAGKTGPKPAAGEPVLLSGGNPQIAKGYGDEPVQAYITAMPGWKHDVGQRLDALIVETVPEVAKAVKGLGETGEPAAGREDVNPPGSACIRRFDLTVWPHLAVMVAPWTRPLFRPPTVSPACRSG